MRHVCGPHLARDGIGRQYLVDRCGDQLGNRGSSRVVGKHVHACIRHVSALRRCFGHWAGRIRSGHWRHACRQADWMVARLFPQLLRPDLPRGRIRLLTRFSCHPSSGAKGGAGGSLVYCFALMMRLTGTPPSVLPLMADATKEYLSPGAAAELAIRVTVTVPSPGLAN